MVYSILSRVTLKFSYRENLPVKEVDGTDIAVKSHSLGQKNGPQLSSIKDSTHGMKA